MTKKKQSRMELEYLALDTLVPYEKNPRKNKDAVPYVKKSIEEFGFKVPIVVDADNVIVAGHTRFLAAKELGLDEVPCLRADDLTEEQIRAFRLADNKVSEFSGWDFEALDAELAALKIDLPDLELADLGLGEGDSVNTDDFFEDNGGEGKKKEPKKVKCTCPECGHEFEQEV